MATSTLLQDNNSSSSYIVYGNFCVKCTLIGMKYVTANQGAYVLAGSCAKLHNSTSLKLRAQ
jgi:hypothetical protein